MKIQLLTLILCLAASCRNDNGSPNFSEKTEATTKFILHEPEQSGLKFQPKIEENYVYNFSHDPYIYNGGGVAVLDFDRDGLQDLLFTARLQGCRLYRNLGNLKFEDVSKKAGVSQHGGLKTGVVVNDFNADGYPDLYICRTWREPVPERRNLLLINNQRGGFEEKAKEFGLDDLAASQQAVFTDFDLDGDLDCYLMNHPVDFKTMNNTDFLPNSTAKTAAAQPPRDEYESAKYFENQGNGKFVDKTKVAGLQNRAFGLSVMASDFNADGYPDLFVGNDFVMPDFLYLNNRNGTFTDHAAEVFLHSSNHSMGADLADLNRDGWQDLVVLDMLAENWDRRQKLMSTMQLERDRAMVERGYGRQVMRNTLQLNNGLKKNGLPDFSEVGCLAGIEATDWSWSPLFADFDHDGWQDLFISNGIKRDMNDLDFFLFTADSINKSGGVSPQRFKNFEEYSSLMPSQSVRNYMFKNSGKMPFDDVSENWGFTKKGFSNGAAYADLDNDGDLDLVTNNLEAAPSLYENTASKNGKHWLQIKLDGMAENPFGIGTKIQVTAGGETIFASEMAVVRGYYSSVEPIFQIGLGDFAKAEKVEIKWLNGKGQILENIPADQRIVLKVNEVTTNWNELVHPIFDPPIRFFKEINLLGLNFKHKENEFEDFNRERLLPYRLSRPGPALATADANGDGLEDIFIGGASGQAGQVFLQKSDGNFIAVAAQTFEKDKMAEDACAHFFDADGDGDQDLLVGSGGNEFENTAEIYRPRFYQNFGKGDFRKIENVFPSEVLASLAVVRSHDFDGDGDLDLFLGSRCVSGRFSEIPRSFILENQTAGGQVKFVEATKNVCPDFEKLGMLTDLQFADLDGDGSAELLVAGDWMPISVFKKEGKFFKNQTASFGLENSSGWWNCLTVKDLDGDGDLDFVAGNEGWNHRLGHPKNLPLQIFASDFDSNGSLELVLCLTDSGKFRPAVSGTHFALQLPSIIRKRVHRYRKYAVMGIEDLFTRSELAAAKVLKTNTLASSWLENVGGKFVQHELPVEAQIAPAQSILADDFDRDGSVDLLILGNDYCSDIETYRQDASNGVFLKLHKSEKRWLPLPSAASGLWANKEARQAVVLNLAGGRRAVFVANNNDLPSIFELKN